MQVSLSAPHPSVHSIVLPLVSSPAMALFGHHALTVVLVAIGVMFLVSLVAFLVQIFTLPSDRGRVN